MDELVRRFHTQLSRREYEELETTWLELVEAQTPPAKMMELAEATVAHGPDGRTTALLSVLAAGLGERGLLAEQLQALRRQAQLTPDDKALARALAECIKRIHGGVPEVEQFLHKSGLGYGQSLREALPKLDRYLALAPGNPVYDSERGPGRVKRLDLLLDRATVDFDDGAELTWDIAAAYRRLRIPHADGFFHRLKRDRAGLLALAAERAGDVLAMYLRDLGVPVGVKKLQEGISAALGPGNWESFWARARREAGRNPHIAVRTGQSRTYQWVEQALEAAEPEQKPARALRRKVGSEELVGESAERVVALFERLKTHPERKHLVETMVASRPDDWPELLAALFRTPVDARMRALIEARLAAERPELWRTLFEGALTAYRQNPDAFIWLAGHPNRDQVAGAKAILSRGLDLLESDLHRPYWTKLRNVLVADEYALLKAALDGYSEQEAGRVAARLGRIRLLEGYRADEMLQLIGEKFPALARDETENVIYTTAAGLEKAKSDLRQLSEVEMPRSAEEIARARAHGDLSENYEYKAAKEKQARLMGRMKSLRDEIARARVVAPADVDTSEVSFGCRVRIADGDAESEYVILGPWEADPDRGVISSLSPFALLLLGKRPGDSLQTGGRTLTVVAIESALAG
jgi:transcription elongation factor GreA